MSDSVTHGLQHTRLLCPSPTPGVHSNSSPLSRWCNPTISSSVVSFSSCPQSFPASGSLQWVSSSHQVTKVLEFQLQHQSFQWIFRTDFLKDGIVWSPCNPGDSQEYSPTPQFRSINSTVLSFLYIILNYILGLPGGSNGKESACYAGDLGSIPWSSRSPGEGKGYSLQCSCLENSVFIGAWWATVHGIPKSRTWLSMWAKGRDKYLQ